jgi:hypothetical protein
MSSEKRKAIRAWKLELKTMAENTQTASANNSEMLSSALERASNILLTLGGMFNAGNEQFAVSNSYIMHSVLAAADLLANAQATCTEQNYFESLEDTKIFAEDSDDMVMVFSPSNELHEDMPPLDYGKSADPLAQTYAELLQKLTAAEVFATEQQALAPPGSNEKLLPLLRSLREEFEKLRKAA